MKFYVFINKPKKPCTIYCTVTVYWLAADTFFSLLFVASCQYFLIFDIDGTLLHYTFGRLKQNKFHKSEISKQHGALLGPVSFSSRSCEVLLMMMLTTACKYSGQCDYRTVMKTRSLWEGWMCLSLTNLLWDHGAKCKRVQSCSILFFLSFFLFQKINLFVFGKFLMHSVLKRNFLNPSFELDSG